MYSTEISTKFSAAHFLESEFMHGHNFKVNARLYGNLNKKGMVIDLDKAKNALDEICNEFDHKVMLSELSADSKNKAGEIRIKEKTYKIADEDVVFLPIQSTTAEYVVEYIANRLKEKFKAQNLNLNIFVEMEENYDSSACFFD